MSTKPKKSKKRNFTKEEELLLNDSDRPLPTIAIKLFYTCGVAMSIVPTWILERLHWTEASSYKSLVFLSPLTMYLLSIAYYNSTLKIKSKVALQRDVVTKKNCKSHRSTKTKSQSPNNDYEAIFGSIFFNNALYLGVTSFCNLILLTSLTPEASARLSTAGIAGALALLSTSSV